jgi:zinc-ribbon domain
VGELIVCKACGNQDDSDETFCTACGAFLEWGGERVATPEPPAPPPPPAATTADVAPAAAPAVPPQAPQAPRPVAPQEGVGARPPEAGARRRAPSVATPAPTAAPPGATACPSCGTGVEPGRRFCQKCGAPLQGRAAAPTRAPRARPAPPAVPWWRRLFGGGVEYHRALSWRTYALRILGALGLAGILGAGFALGGANPINWPGELWDRFGPVSLESVDVAGVALEPPDAAAFVDPDNPPDFAVDGVPDRAWVSGWDPARADGDAAEGPCAEGEDPAGTAAIGALVLTLPEQRTVAELRVVAGLTEEGPRTQQFRPRVLRVASPDACRMVTLEDDAGAQTVDVDLGATDAVLVAIVDAYPPKVGEDARVAISEVEVRAEKE